MSTAFIQGSQSQLPGVEALSTFPPQPLLYGGVQQVILPTEQGPLLPGSVRDNGVMYPMAGQMGVVSQPVSPVQTQQHLVAGPGAWFGVPEDVEFGRKWGWQVGMDSYLGFALIALFEIMILFFYGFFARFTTQPTAFEYATFQDINVMVMIGFGFLQVALKGREWSSVGLSLMGAVMAVQVYPLVGHFWRFVFADGWGGDVILDISQGSRALFSAAAVLVSFGVLLGRLSMPQLLVLTLLEVFVFAFNEALVLQVLGLEDLGGSDYIHLFGASFGIAAAALCGYSAFPRSGRPSSTILAFGGALFLWVYFPSFNSALALSDAERIRASMNTHIALAASALSAFAISPLLNSGRLEPVQVLHAALAGGVAIAASANWIFNPVFSVAFGCIAAIIATLAIRFLDAPLRQARLGDAIGTLGLLLLPALFGGLLSGLMVAIWFDKGTRSASAQGGIQVACTFISLGVGAVAGAVVGLIVRFIPRSQPVNHSATWVFE